MTLQQTIDQDHRPATYGIERGTPWVEYAEGKPGRNEGRTALYGHSPAGKKRMASEIIRRGIRVSQAHLNLLQLSHAA